MDCTKDPKEVQAFGLIDSLDQTWLKIPLACMAEVGPPAQTLAGLLKITNQKTFVSTREIASEARVPLATARKHLESLARHGWVENQGRGRTRSGRPRRTATRKLTGKCKKSLEPYAILPWWACCFICGTDGGRNIGRLRWSTKAVMAVVLGRLLSLKAVVEREEQFAEDLLTDAIDGLSDENGNRFRFSLSYLERQTGLTRESLVSAKRDLKELGIVEWFGDGSETDCLCPRWDFQVVKTPAEPGFCRVSFRNAEG